MLFWSPIAGWRSPVFSGNRLYSRRKWIDSRRGYLIHILADLGKLDERELCRRFSFSSVTSDWRRHCHSGSVRKIIFLLRFQSSVHWIFPASGLTGQGYVFSAAGNNRKDSLCRIAGKRGLYYQDPSRNAVLFIFSDCVHDKCGKFLFRFSINSSYSLSENLRICCSMGPGHDREDAQCKDVDK